MSDALAPEAGPAAERLARRAGAALKLAARLLLGLFVLWQFLFLPVYNLLDMESILRRDLRDARQREGRVWNVIAGSGAEAALVEWLDTDQDQEDRGAIGNALKRPHAVVEWWARRTGQEQGWGLFSPNTVDWICFFSVELRWDEPGPPAPLRTPAPGLSELALTGAAAARRWAATPVRLLSDNQPRDVTRFVRFGNFRLRRIEARFDVDLRHNPSAADGGASDWESAIRGRVGDERRELIAYLRWRMERYRREHPESPRPTQVVLHARTWTIPPPPSPRPFAWNEEVETPFARWLPGRDGEGSVLEAYLPTKRAFGSP